MSRLAPDTLRSKTSWEPESPKSFAEYIFSTVIGPMVAINSLESTW